MQACNEHFPLFLAYYGREYIKSQFADFHFDFMSDVEVLSKPVPIEALWCGFRECAKTSIAKWAVVWLVASKKKKNIPILSYRDANSAQFALDVAKELSENPIIKKDYGIIYEKSRESTEITKKTAKDFECLGGIWVQAATIGIDPRGLLKGSQRPDLVVIDDIENNDTINSKVETEKIRMQITSILGGIDFEKGSVLYLGNYLSSIGNIAWIKEKLEESKGIVRFIPAMVNDVPTWKRFTYERLMEKKKSLGSLMFDTEYMLIPVSDTMRVFRKEFFRYVEISQAMREAKEVYITIDPAYTKTETSDYTGFVVNFLSDEGLWRIKAWQERLSPMELVEKMFSLNAMYRPTTIMIEEFAYTSGLKPYLDSEMRKRNAFLPIISTNAHNLASKIGNSATNKEQRIQNALLPLYESGTIQHIVGECTELEDQLLRHPINTHDDIIDALAYQRALVGTEVNVEIYTPEFERRNKDFYH